MDVWSPIITLRLDDGSGMAAGAMKSADLYLAASPMLAKHGVCPGNSTLDFVRDLLVESADTSAGVKGLQDPSTQCNAISFGFIFETVPSSPPLGVDPPYDPWAPDDCPRP